LPVLNAQESPDKVQVVPRAVPAPLGEFIVWRVLLNVRFVPLSEHILDGPPQVVKDHGYHDQIMQVKVGELTPSVVDEN
jgi:hypothetical protein